MEKKWKDDIDEKKKYAASAREAISTATTSEEEKKTLKSEARLELKKFANPYKLYRLSGGLCAAIRECVGLSTVYKRDGGALARVVRVSNVSSWCKHGTALPYLRETCACDVPCPPLTSCARHSYSRQYRDRGDAAAQSCPKRSASGTFNIEKGVDLCTFATVQK